jgi:citrate/tricarballylate utilization protein
MSLDITPIPALDEARRQVEICNACRYCEGYCSVFPAMFRDRSFADADLTQLANLCHNCRGCYYACQYTEPHEFALNLPAILAEVRVESWENYAWPAPLSRLFHRSGVALSAAFVVAISLIFWATLTLAPSVGQGFYASLSHNIMVTIFVPAFLLPFIAMAVGLRRYWRDVGGKGLHWADIQAATVNAATMRNLDGGQGQGCNFEDQDRFSNARRHAHQATMWGFLLCFAATTTGTILHYVFDIPAPYPFVSLPKLFGISGGILLTIGCGALAWLKTKADPALGARSVWGGEMAFVLLLGFTGASGLALYMATGSDLVTPILALHLGAVLGFFLTAPYSKMAHGFYRFAALIREAQIRASQ